MNILSTTIRAVAKRPSIVLIPAVIGFFCYLLNAYNPVTSFIAGIASITGSTVLDSLVSLIQMLIDPIFLPVILGAFVLVVLAGSLFAGLVLSGYFNIISSEVDDRPKTRGEFGEGMRAYFLKYFLISLRALPFLLLLLFFILIAGVPALIVTRATITEKPELLTATVFVDVLTIAVLLFAVLFSVTYILFWYPSARINAKKSFSYTKRTVDTHFWRVTPRILLFGLIFVLAHYAIFAASSYLIQHILGWLFDTAFFTTLSVYVFYAFKDFTVTPAADE